MNHTVANQVSAAPHLLGVNYPDRFSGRHTNARLSHDHGARSFDRFSKNEQGVSGFSDGTRHENIKNLNNPITKIHTCSHSYHGDSELKPGTVVFFKESNGSVVKEIATCEDMNNMKLTEETVKVWKLAGILRNYNESSLLPRVQIATNNTSSISQYNVVHGGESSWCPHTWGRIAINGKFNNMKDVVERIDTIGYLVSYYSENDGSKMGQDSNGKRVPMIHFEEFIVRCGVEPTEKQREYMFTDKNKVKYKRRAGWLSVARITDTINIGTPPAGYGLVIRKEEKSTKCIITC